MPMAERAEPPATAMRADLAGRHFVCAVAESVITDWKRLLTSYSETSRPFFVYGSNSPAFARYAQAETTLWVVQLRRAEHPVLAAKICVAARRSERGKPRPKLDSRLDDLVERFHARRTFESRSGAKVTQKGWRYVAYDAGRGSRFFPFNDATEAVLRTLFELRTPLGRKPPKREALPAAWRASFGSRLLSPALLRKIDADENPFVQLERAIAGRDIFVSYRHKESERAEQLVRALEARGIPFWFDRSALPVAEATRRLESDEPTLTLVLDQGLHDSAWLVALADASYGGPSECTRDVRGRGVRSWTRYEWRTAKHRILYDLDPAHGFAETARPAPNFVLRSADPEDAATEIAQIIADC
jgi:hypothetical protein